MSTRSSYLRRPKSAVRSRSAKAGSRSRPATASSRRYKSSKNAKATAPAPDSVEEIKPVPKLIDIIELIENVLRESSVDITEQMQPQIMFGKFLQKNMFDKVIIRNMQEIQTTLDRNEAIQELVVKSPNKYRLFKVCLAETGQFPLVEILQIREIRMHDALKGSGYICTCTNTDNCSTLMAIRCSPAKYMRIALSQPQEENVLLKLQNNLINIYQHFRLYDPVFPLAPGETVRMNTLYVRPSLSTVKGTPSNIKAYIQNMKNNTKRKFMESYEELFYKDGKPSTNIYIAGESGTGKSALCERLVRTWCEAHTAKQNCTFDTCGLDQDHKTMSEFSLLFYISLSAADEEVDIEDMIRKQQLTNFDVSRFLENEKCLVILDGLDEWKTRFGDRSTILPTTRRAMNETIVLTTSRPWKIESLNLNNNDVDHLIIMSPLNKVSSDLLSENVIRALEGEMDKKSGTTNKLAGSFIKDITSSHKLELLDVPILQIHLLRLWCEETPFGRSKCQTFSAIVNDLLKHASLTTTSSDEDFVNDMSDFDLPKCLTSNQNCLENKKLLESLSKLAFITLSKTSREDALVFDFAEAKTNGLCEEDIRACMNIGILTQNMYFGVMKEDMKIMKFINKSHHEFFAALYLASYFKEKGIKELATVIDGIGMVIELEEMIVFSCGMDRSLVYEMSKHMCRQLSNLEEIKQHRNSSKEPKHETAYQWVLKIQSLIAKCTVEAFSDDFADIGVFASDLIICSETLNEIKIYLNSIVPETIELLSISTLSGKDVDYTLRQAIDLTNTASNLKKFHLDDSDNMIDIEKIYMTIESTHTTLCALVLSNIQLVELGDKIETMLTYPQLKSLGLISVSLSNEQLQFLTIYLAEKSQLCELQLVELLGTSGKAYCYKLDLSEQKRLEKLYLRDLYVEEITMDASKLLVCEISYLHITGVMKAVLNYLKEETKLREFICHGCSQATDVNAIADSLRHFISLRSVVLENIDFDRFVPRVTSGAEHLRSVSLENVTMTETALLRLFGSFPAEAITVNLDRVSLVEINEENEEPLCDILNNKYPGLSVAWNLCRAMNKQKRWQSLAINTEKSD